MVSFSAKDLVSKSYRQIKYFTVYPEKRPTPNQNVNDGVKHQHEIALCFEDLIGEEMRGSYFKDDIVINFSNDIVCKDKIVEVKTLNREAEDWYFENSVLQCAFYKSLLSKSNRKLVTANFFKELGNPSVEITVNENIPYFLKFGEELYEVNVKDAETIVSFFYKKAIASMNWDSATEFDNQYKFKEFELLKNCFTFNKI